MKKCVIGALCVLSFSMMVIMSCNKKDRSAPVVVQPQISPENPLNPYDSFGYWHNLILDSLDAQRSKGKCQDPSSYCTYVGRFCATKNWPKHREKHHEEAPQVVVDFTTDPDGFIQRLSWSDSVKVWLNSLFSQIEILGTEKCAYKTFKNAIVKFERQAQESTLPATDKEVILKATSVARFSGYRWSNQPELSKEYDQDELISYFHQRGITTPVAKVSQKEPGLFKRIGRWFAVTSVDIGAAIELLSIADGAEISGFLRITMEHMDQFH